MFELIVVVVMSVSLNYHSAPLFKSDKLYNSYNECILGSIEFMKEMDDKLEWKIIRVKIDCNNLHYEDEALSSPT